MISERVLKITKEILSESLGVSADEITLKSYLIEDLGSESIDFLDIFHLAEIQLGIRITEGDLAPELRPPADDEEWEEDINRELKEDELQKLRDRLPASTHDRIVPGLHVYEIVRLINVEALASFFEGKVAAKEAEESGITRDPDA